MSKSIYTRATMRDAVRRAFTAHMNSPAALTDRPDEAERFYTLATAIRHLAICSDADLRSLSKVADDIGFSEPALTDTRKAAARLARWQALLEKKA